MQSNIAGKMRIREWRLEYEAGNKRKYGVITLKMKSKSSPSAIVNKEEARQDDGGVRVVTVQFSEHAKTPYV